MRYDTRSTVELEFEVGCIHIWSTLLGNCSLQYVIRIDDYIPVLYVSVRSTIADKEYSAYAEQSDQSKFVRRENSESLFCMLFKIIRLIVVLLSSIYCVTHTEQNHIGVVHTIHRVLQYRNHLTAFGQVKPYPGNLGWLHSARAT